MTGMVPAMAAQAGQSALYDLVKGNILGLRKVHVQMHDLTAAIALKGVDFVPLFP
jgi:hypothetical protein